MSNIIAELMELMSALIAIVFWGGVVYFVVRHIKRKKAAEKQAAEEAVYMKAQHAGDYDRIRRKLDSLPLFDNIVELLIKESPWISAQQDYYDDNPRRIFVSSIWLMATAEPVTQEKYQYRNGDREEFDYRYTEKYRGNAENNVLDCMLTNSKCSAGYSFTRSGYEPLKDYTTADGYVIKQKEVVEIATEVFRNKLMNRLPDAEFSKISEVNTMGYDSEKRRGNKDYGYQMSELGGVIKYFTFKVPELQMKKML